MNVKMIAPGDTVVLIPKWRVDEFLEKGYTLAEADAEADTTDDEVSDND
jgi:hypothetical protein